MHLRVPIVVLVACAGAAHAKPPAAAVFCTKYPLAPACNGQQPACTFCHTAAPQRNQYGGAVEAQLAPGVARPLSDGDFSMALPAALAAVESADTDADGVSNLVEIQKGTLPADPRSFPADQPCAGGANPRYDVCHYDPKYVFRKLELDFCGFSPSYEQVKAFAAMDDAARRAHLDAELDRCLGTEFWRGKNGQLWKLAHPKVRPVGSLKAGEDQGAIPLADYYDDYALFAYAHTDDHDARDVLLADYYVQRQVTNNVTSYSKVTSLSTQAVDQAHRAGNMTTTWSLTFFVMFTALPRNAASQMYRAYLGLDIAKQEGLYSVSAEPRDYDAKGVQTQACAVCHATLDPLAYPFRNYNGIGGPRSLAAQYVPNRLETLFPNEAPTLRNTPESGAIFGRPVANLREWAQTAANSDAFAIAVVTDYWKLLVGHAPTSAENAEFVQTWQRFKTTHDCRVKPMLHDLMKTEAYGAP